MPRGDRTGPMGNGPMTGLRKGDCADGTTRFGFRGSFASRFGFGRNHGFGWRWSEENQSISEESSLKTGISMLKDQLKALEGRLQNLRGGE